MFEKVKQKMLEIESNTTMTPGQKIDAITNLSDLLEEVAVTIADEHNLVFSVGEYGSGRTYYPAGEYEDWDGETNVEGVWISSSENC